MGKVARRGRGLSISRSGLWMLGGVLLLSAAVLAWALQSDTPTGPVHSILRPAPAVRSTARRPADRTDVAVAELAQRPPPVEEYNPLLQGNVFQPRVIQRDAHAGGAPTHAAAHRQPARAEANPGGPVSTDSWHDWKYNGVAQLDEQTYALMDQENKKQSRFVKAGDHLEDAIVERVGENEVTLHEAGGNRVHLKRVDAMAELMRSVRTAGTASRLAAPPNSGAAPSPAVPGGGAAAPSSNSPMLPQAAPAAPGGADDGSQGRRRGRRFRQSDDAGNAGG